MSKKHPLNTWALVLAAGEGSRLRGLTRNAHGVAVPKQFCSLRGGPSLLDEALHRASAVAPIQRICTVVAAQHQTWWDGALDYLSPDNVIVQPLNRGTAHGMLLPLIQIAAQDPKAIVVVLPADHYFRDEAAMANSLRTAAANASENQGAIFLLGIEPDEADVELGYIVPATDTAGEPGQVLRFVEKPTSMQAERLVAQGALWNVFIAAGSVSSFLALFDARFDAAKTAMRARGAAELVEAYHNLSSVDFSRDVLQGNEAKLRVIPVPQCGWTDLGTPQRLGRTLESLAVAPGAKSGAEAGTEWELADEYARSQLGRDHWAKFGHVDLRA